MLFERDRQVILIFDTVVVADIRAAGRTAALERIGHVDGQTECVRLLIAAFALILQTRLMNHLRIDDPGLGHPQVVTSVLAARSAFRQHNVAAAASSTAATAEATAEA